MIKPRPLVGAFSCVQPQTRRRANLLQLTRRVEVLEITQDSLRELLLTRSRNRDILILSDISGLEESMPATVTQTASQWAAAMIEEVEGQEPEEPSILKKFSLRLPEESSAFLEYLSGKLRMSRSRVGEELLVRAIEEAVCAVGLPGPEDGFQWVLDEEAFKRKHPELYSEEVA